MLLQVEKVMELLDSPEVDGKAVCDLFSGYDDALKVFSHKSKSSRYSHSRISEISLGDRIIVLNKGEGITYPSALLHKWRKVGKVTTVGICVVSLPTLMPPNINNESFTSTTRTLKLNWVVGSSTEPVEISNQSS